MCSFTVLGGSENQSVSGVTTICLMQCNTSPSHRVDQVVDCGLVLLLLTHKMPYTLSALYSENRDSSMKRTLLQSARPYRMWTFAHSSWLWRWTAVRSRPWWGWRVCRWASLRRFLTVCAEIFGYANRLLQQLSGWLVSDDLGGEDAGCGGPGLVWLHVLCGCEAG